MAHGFFVVRYPVLREQVVPMGLVCRGELRIRTEVQAPEDPVAHEQCNRQDDGQELAPGRQESARLPKVRARHQSHSIKGQCQHLPTYPFTARYGYQAQPLALVLFFLEPPAVMQEAVAEG
jgi:hypothetical protein